MNIIKITKNNCKSKQEVDVENYLTKKKWKKGISKKQISNISEENKQRLKEYQKKYCKAKKTIKNFYLFFFIWYKNRTKIFDFW